MPWITGDAFTVDDSVYCLLAVAHLASYHPGKVNVIVSQCPNSDIRKLTFNLNLHDYTIQPANDRQNQRAFNTPKYSLKTIHKLYIARCSGGGGHTLLCMHVAVLLSDNTNSLRLYCNVVKTT